MEYFERTGIATVTAAGEQIGLVQDCALGRTALFAPLGYHYRPPEGTELLTVELGGLPVGIASPMEGQGLAPGEVRIAAGGGYLHLRGDGCVLINGLCITPQGELLPARGGTNGPETERR